MKCRWNSTKNALEIRQEFAFSYKSSIPDIHTARQTNGKKFIDNKNINDSNFWELIPEQWSNAIESCNEAIQTMTTKQICTQISEMNSKRRQQQCVACGSTMTK